MRKYKKKDSHNKKRSCCNENCNGDNIDWNKSADFVIVGMGAAGAVVTRMLVDAGFSVIGIEAGVNYDSDPLILDSTNAGELEEEYTWKFFFNQETAPNPDMNDRTLNYTTGRLLGGGSSINGMQYVRSSDAIWTSWEAINGSKWSAHSASKGYKKLEKFIGSTGNFNPNSHGTNGLMKIRQAPIIESTMANKFATALSIVAGQPIIADYNDPFTPIGTFTRWSLFEQADGNRASSSTDFLTPLLNSCNCNNCVKCSKCNKCSKCSNYKNKKCGGCNKCDNCGKCGKCNTCSKCCNTKILLNTTVTKIIFSKCGKVLGVNALHNGECIKIRACKEVILSCGIHSCEILQRSGIGPTTLLESLKIPVIFGNDSVGNNSRNHLISTVIFSANPADYPGVPVGDPQALYVGGAFLPDPTNPIDPTKRGFQWIGVNPNPDTLAVIFYKLNPKSIGTDQIQNKDPLRVSAVTENLLSDPSDLDAIINVYQQQITALDTELSTIDPLYALVDPPLSTINDIDKLKDYIKDNLDHAHHWTGTCKMAPLSQGGVVNCRGKVYGTKGLRVADISVAPVMPDGNTAGPAFFVGYKISKMIIKKYKCSS